MFSDPEKIVQQIALTPGQTVADLGAGNGAFTLAIAKALKGTGKIYAIEVQKEVLVRLQNACKEVHLGNVGFVLGNFEEIGGTKLRDQSVDVVLLSNVLFQLTNKQIAIEEVKRILRHEGKLVVIDWTDSFKNMGPAPEHVFTEYMARPLVESLSFTFDHPIDAGNFHYGLVFRKGIYRSPRTINETRT